MLGLPVLGALGRMSARREHILAQPRAQNHGAERLRALRTTLLLDRMERVYQTMLVTSPASGLSDTDTSYPAQQESLATSLSKVWAASFNPSTVVR